VNHDIQVIALHSVAVNLLTKGPVLDAGCRGFEFAKWFSEHGHEVYAMDPSPDICDVPKGVTFLREALVGKGSGSSLFLAMNGDPESWCVTSCSIVDKGIPVKSATLDDIPYTLWTETWDVIKLNVEGSEYRILESFPGPIARQVVVSFHEHTPARQGRAECDRIIDRLREWYTPVQHVWDARYCAGFNYWDTLLIRNDLA